MELKVGDKVKIRADLEDGEWYGTLCTNDGGGMREWYGKVLTVSKTWEDGKENRFLCEETKSEWAWSHEMVESVVSKGSYTIEEILKNPENFIVRIRNKEDYDNLRCYSGLRLTKMWLSHKYYLIWKGTQSSDRAYLKENYPNCKLIKFDDIVFPQEGFKKEDYIVLLGESSSSYLKPHWCFIHSGKEDYFHTDKCCQNQTTARSLCTFDKQGTAWRYATTEEIEEYNRLDKPFDTRTLRKEEFGKPEKRKLYTLEELADRSNKLVCYLETEGEWQKVKDSGICRCTSNFYGPYCYALFEGTYSGTSTRTYPGDTHCDFDIVYFDQIQFPNESVEVDLPKKWYYPYTSKEEFDAIKKHFNKNWAYHKEDGYAGYSSVKEQNNWVWKPDVRGLEKITREQFIYFIGEDIFNKPKTDIPSGIYEELDFNPTPQEGNTPPESYGEPIYDTVKKEPAPKVELLKVKRI